MVREFKLPDVGEGLTEAEIVTWLVKVGDTVTEDQPVAEVETDKAVVEVPAPVNGTVREILAEEGEMVPVGEVIITFDVEGEPVEPMEDAADEGGAESRSADTADVESAVSAVEEADSVASTDGESGGEVSAKGGRVFAAPSARRLARELGVDIETVAGSGPGGRVTEGDVRAAAESGGASASAASEDGTAAEPAVRSATRKVTDEPAAGSDDGSAPADAHPGGAPEAAGRDRTLAAPATRQVAAEEGIDIDDVPTDEIRDGEPFVDAEQVRAYAEAQRAAQQADTQAVTQATGGETATTAAGATAADTETTPEGQVERVPYRGIRRTIGKAMENSKYTAPHVTHHDTVVVDDLVDTRARLKPKAEERGIKLTYMPFIVKAIVAALKEFPILNSQLDEDEEEILVKHYHNIGIAVATEAGLMVPVVKSAGEKDMLTIASEVNELASKARDRSISREEMQGGTFSITNFGAIGGEYATPIINYPETAILGLGELKERPVVEDGEVVAKHTIPISLTIDHRVIDGADAAQFANTLMEYLQNPELLLLE
ncbi:dihydrolipoamide acetyltransferase family protein [Haloglomus litoreum]|uniref:dihydrolipoamide acetyltransferase family protein n=1 Tax=Haloglomus litoreum TaxID=3034026 RepID=UPI0023E8E18C|nr:dihydrolipoamide acetyltransferase family protein [Haloglomus sp. DT116]